MTEGPALATIKTEAMSAEAETSREQPSVDDSAFEGDPRGLAARNENPSEMSA